MSTHGPTTESTGRPPQGIATPRCERRGCGAHIPAQTRLRGDAQRFCSPECRSKAWDDAHPRQKALDFATPAPKLNSTAPKARKKSLQRKCFLILNRLEQGPASAMELVEIGGLRFGARLDELRPFLRSLCGFDPWDKERNPVLCSKQNSPNPVYMLSSWAEPAAREANRSHVRSLETGAV